MGKDHELLDCARSGDIAQVAKLLEQIAKRASGPLSSFRRSPSINGQDMNGYTPLHHACLNGHSNIVRLLLAHDALPDVPDIRGSTPLYLASWAGHQDIVKMLLMHPRRPVNPNTQTTDNETPLHCAAQHGHNSALAILLSYGADPTIRNDSFQTPLDLAAHFGRLQAVQILLRTHPELIEPYKTKAASTFNLQKYLPQNYAATSPTKHIFTHTCLHLASRNGHKKVVETLLAAGVDVNILTHAGSALHEAALCGKKSVATTLLQAGIDPYATDGNGRTALDLLKDYPPHVTYEISSVIREFCKNQESKHHFKPIDKEDNTFIRTTENDIREKSHSIPKSACIKKLNDHAKSIANIGLSSSLNSLKNETCRLDNYIQMRPIMSLQQQSSDINVVTKKRNDYEDYSLEYKSNTLDGRRTQKKDVKLNKSFELKNADNGTIIEPLYSNTRYRCIDEYVKMSNPNQSTSNLSTPDKQLASQQQQYNSNDYANLNELKGINDESFKQDRRRFSLVTPTNNSSSLDANNNKPHSPTPDFPPPSVSQAEDAILEFIHPPRLSLSMKKPNKRRSIHIDCNDNTTDDDLDSFIMKHINLDDFNNVKDETKNDNADNGDADDDDDDEALTKLLRPKYAKSIPTPTYNSRSSDCVEEFIGDAPFAGLFKGSMLNLANDDIDPFLNAPPRLRSPSLVRSVRPLPPKRNIPSPKAITTNSLEEEEFNANKVWNEINDILESIHSEMNDNELDIYDDEEKISNDEDLSMPNENQQNELAIPTPIKIRNPSELLLGVKNNANAKWCHSPNALIYGQVVYEVFYLGSTVIRDMQGTISTRKSIQKLKRGDTPLGNEQENSILENCNTSTKYLKAANKQAKLQVGIALSHVGVRFIDVTEKSTICVHDIQNINCVCQDAEDLRYFAYVTKEQELHYCHVFMVDAFELATEIILTLGQAFEVAYQLALVKDNESS